MREEIPTLHYVTTDGTFYLYADESATFYGVKSGDKVEIRKYTDPDSYSVLSTLSGNAEFAYVKAADSTETPQRDYASITVQYGDELNQRQNPTFTNVPNVLQVKKRVVETKIDTEKEFAFTIQKLKPDTTDPSKPLKNGDDEYVIDVNNFVVKFPTADGTYRITEVDPNDWNDQNNSKGNTAPNPKHEEYLYITDVDYDTYAIQTGGDAKIDRWGNSYNNRSLKHKGCQI